MHGPKRLTFRPVGKACFFGDSGAELADFLRQQYGEIPVTLTDLAQKEPSFVRVPDMPFAFYHIWVYLSYIGKFLSTEQRLCY